MALVDMDTFEVTWKYEKTQAFHEALPEFPLEEFQKVIKEIQLDSGKENVSFQQYEYKKSRTYKKDDLETQLWQDMNCTHGALDLLATKDEIIGGIFTNGQATTYLVKRGYIQCSPFSDWKSKVAITRQLGTSQLYYVETNDGIKLGTRVWLPEDYREGEKFPVILIRTCYNSEIIGFFERIAVTRGYAVVIQDVRGRNTSEGDFLCEYYEKKDAKGTLAWMKKQVWYGGKIGVIGASYLGYTAWATMASGDKDIVAAVSMVTAGSPFYGDADRKNGAYSSTCMLWDVFMSKYAKEIDFGKIDIDKALESIPIGSIDEMILNKPSLIWKTFMQHPDYDSFWKEVGLRQHGEQIDVPVLYVTGYHEGCIGGTIEMWDMCERYKRKNQYLVCGPWFHDFNGNRRVLKNQLSADAILYNPDLLYAQWFDHWMLGKEMPTLEPLNLYIEGENVWKSKKNWMDNMIKHTYYLSSNADLKENLDEETVTYSYVYDPFNPTKQIIEEEECLVPADYQELEKNSDMVYFTTAPMTRTCRIIGTPKVELYAASSALDTDFVVRLTHVTKKHESLAMAYTIQRAKYRESYEFPTLLEPGKIYRYEFALPWIGRTIYEGDCIRLEVCSAAEGDFFPNRNTGSDPSCDTETVIAEQTIYCGNDMPSKIMIPMENEEK